MYTYTHNTLDLFTMFDNNASLHSIQHQRAAIPYIDVYPYIRYL